MKRTHNCGELRKADIGKEVVLCGWVQSRRDHGGVIFIDLRDRYGLTQVVFDPAHNAPSHKTAEKLRREWVIQATGHVRARPKGMANPKLPTGEIEVISDHIEILNESEVPPFEIEDRADIAEERRLKYRYLDLRRPAIQARLEMRHKAAQAVREYLSSQGFLEIETPMLVRTTPGGARVFKVPSRTHPGKFYSLPESPQLYKQLLMVAGFDRYFQLARCLRDEDLRIDRQPEFTQIDLEMSFADEEDIFKVVEGMFKHLFKKILGVEIKTPFQKITYNEAMSRFGSDKPDMRFGLELTEVTEAAKRSNFSAFKSTIERGGVVYCLKVPGCAKFSRKEIEELEGIARTYHAPGLVWLKVINKTLEGSIAKHLPEDARSKLLSETKARSGDLLLLIADKFKLATTALGALRLHLGEKLRLIKNDFKFCWVVDFPLYEFNEEEQRWQAAHHIFTMPKEEDLRYLEEDPGRVRGRLYDIVLNGIEVGGGSIRNHRKDLQVRCLKVIGIDYDEAERQFDFLLDAFKYGAPPHGGIALGFDRIVALMSGINDIREVIAFPRNKLMENPMDGSPQDWTSDFLKELHLKLDIAKKK